MAMQAQTIVARACAIAKMPNQQPRAGEQLNVILQELAQTYDINVAMKTTTITLNPGQGPGPYPWLQPGAGPYILPTDYLRDCKNGLFYFVFGVPYTPINLDLDMYDAKVQQGGISNYPEMFATDTSNDAITKNGAPVLFVWPPSGGTYVATLRYWSLPPDILTPETSGVVPWFPNTNYLITRLAGEMMKPADDARTSTFLGNGPEGAQGILDRYLKLQIDDEGRAKTVELDRRNFGKSFNRLPQTKTLGW